MPRRLRTFATWCRGPASRADGLDALMKEMARAEVVVASRFHNVIAALKMRKPTVSLGYAGKNRRLLAEFGLEGLDQPLDSFEVDLLVSQMAEARRRQPAVATVMEETLRRFDEELGDQFGRLSAEVFDRTRVSRLGTRLKAVRRRNAVKFP